MSIKEENKPNLINTSFNDIQAKLDKKLGPEYISKRVGFGTSRVAYIEGWRAINLANQIFGYNGWSTEVKNVIVDFLDERQGKFSVGCTAIVRVTLSNGTYREDIGYGTVENERRKAAAFERAKKSAVTDALKRSLRSFGNALGNCLYDKDFLAKIDKVKFDPPDFDENNLFRPSDEISEVSRSGTMDGDNSNSNQNIPNKRRQLAKVGSTSNLNPAAANPNPTTNKSANNSTMDKDDTDAKNSMSKQEQDDLLDDSLMFSDDFQDEDFVTAPKKVVPPTADNKMNEATKIASNDPLLMPSNDPVTFVTGKGATSLQQKKISDDAIFDPKYKAQSIKHTLDQTTSSHVPVSALKDKPPSREKIYQQYAPKGKGLEPPVDKAEAKEANAVATNATTTTNDAQTSHNEEKVTINKAPVTSPLDNVQKTPQNSAPVTTNKFAPPSGVIHPNSYLPAQNKQQSAPFRREVGRPKVNPLQMRKPNP